MQIVIRDLTINPLLLLEVRFYKNLLADPLFVLGLQFY